MARKQTDRPGSHFASILLEDGTQKVWRLENWAPGDLQYCINCRQVPSTLYNLQCSHKLCHECFYKSSCFVCPMDHTKSELHKRHFKTRHPEIPPSVQLTSPEKKLAPMSCTIGPPPGFGGHVSPAGRGRGLLSSEASPLPTGYDKRNLQVRNPTVSASLGTQHEDMDIEETHQAMNPALDNESVGIEDGTTTYVPCFHCALPVKIYEIKEHFNHCSDVFSQWRRMIWDAVLRDYQKQELEGLSIFPGHRYTCPGLDLECKRLYTVMMDQYTLEHHGHQCPASKAGSSCLQKHEAICPKFIAICSKFVNQVVDKYRQYHSSNECPGNNLITEGPRRDVHQSSSTQTSTPHGETEQVEDIAPCPNCSASLKIEDIEDHAENCPKLLVCEKCSGRVVAKDYRKHLDDHCPGSKQSCTSSQVDDNAGHQGSAWSVAHETHQADDNGEGSTPCPYCHNSWDSKDLQEHIKNCRQEQIQALHLPSAVTDDRKPVDDLFQGRKPDTVQKPDEDKKTPANADDDVKLLKKRVKELEKRIENIERPLGRLIERLMNNK